MMYNFDKYCIGVTISLDVNKKCKDCIAFTCMHLADVFIQSDLHCIQVIHFLLSVCVFPGN